MRPTTSTRPGWQTLLPVVLIALAAIALRWPVLELGMMSDDYAQYAMIAGLYPGTSPYAPFDLYAFFRDDPATLAAHVGNGTVPWWTSEELHGSVMRPLSSALLSLDHALWPAQAEHAMRRWHLHSLLWLGAYLLASGLALRRLLGPWIAALAVLLMACDACYVTPLVWLANRCSIVSAAFAALALWAHVRWREGAGEGAGEGEGEAKTARAWPSLVFCALALAASEYGLAAPAYILAYELLVGRELGSSPRRAGLRRALRAVMPAAGITLLWLGLHRALGYGTQGSAVYVDPLTAPLAWLGMLAERLPRLLGSLLWGLPADTGDMLRRFDDAWLPWPIAEGAPAQAYVSAHVFVCALLLLAMLGVWLLARALLEPQERARLLALLLGAGLSLVPLSVAPAHSRLLVTAQLGACALVAGLSVGGLRLLGAWFESARGRRVRALACLAPLALLVHAHTLAELRWGRLYVEVLVQIERSLEQAFVRGDLLGADGEGRDLGGRELIVVNAHTQTVAFHGHFWLDSEGYPRPASWRPLALAPLPFVAVREGPRSLELSTIQGALLESGAELFFRREGQGLPAPTELRWPGLEVAILADDGEGHPTRVRFTLPAPLEDPRYLFLITTPEGLMRWTPPPLGQRAIVPRPRLPLPLGPP